MMMHVRIGMVGRVCVCVCVGDGGGGLNVEWVPRRCSTAVFARVSPRGVCVLAGGCFPPLHHCTRPLPANANCLLICHSCSGKCNSDPPPGYIHPPQVSGLPSRPASRSKTSPRPLYIIRNPATTTSNSFIAHL